MPSDAAVWTTNIKIGMSQQILVKLVNKDLSKFIKMYLLIRLFSRAERHRKS